uniref:Uncharacterized protein n=1 Tax=Rhizophora mucronata TaxID=61149 RepID=A0A2P2JGG9_RHIMU
MKYKRKKLSNLTILWKHACEWTTAGKRSHPSTCQLKRLEIKKKK